MKQFCIYLLATLSSLASFAQKQDRTVTYLYDETAQPPEMFVDVSYLKGEVLKIEPMKRYVETRTTYTFSVLRNSVDSLVLSAPGAKITSLKLDKAAAKYRQDGDKLIVYASLAFHSQHELEIELNTICKPGAPAFTGWDDTTGLKRKQIWGLGLSAFFPDFGIKHDLMITDLTVRFDSKYKVFSNGTRLSQEKNKDNTTTWHYKMQHEQYFAMLVLVIGDFDYKTFSTASGTPLEYWYYTDRPNTFEPTYRYSKEMFTFFEEDMGLKYPWESYRQAPVIDCPFGGMETTTSTIFNDGMQCDERAFMDYRNYVNVNAHELTHQWFGDYTSYTNGQNVWVSESFATYYAKKFEQRQLGENQYQKIRSEELARTLAASKTDDYPVGHGKGVTARWYPKGSLVIGMMRYVMGEKEFKTFIAYYLKKHPYAIVDWNDLKVAIRESTGQTLDWFFDEWIQRGGEPEYTVSYKQLETLDHQRGTHVSVLQTHATNDLIGFFKMPVKVQVYYKDGSMDEVTAQVEKEFTDVTVPNKSNKEIAFVLFDPNRNIVKRLKFTRSNDELFAQLKNAANMIDRYDALIELKSVDANTKRDALIASFKKEDFHLIRNEVLGQLAEDTNAASIAMFRQALGDKDVNVRRAAASTLKVVPEQLRKEYEVLLTDSSYQLIAIAMENLVNSFPDKAASYLSTMAAVDGNQFHNIHVKWLELDYDKNKTPSSLNALRAYCDIDHYDNPTASSSIYAMKRLNYLDAPLVGLLFKAGKYWSGLLNPSAKTTLEYFYEQTKYKKMIKDEYAKLDAEQRTQWKDLVK